MKAILDHDIIVRLGVGDVDIGRVPKTVGLERLRWNGEKLVDLADLDTFWVVAIGLDFFILHAVEVPKSVEIVMNYSDRKRLIVIDGAIKLKTDEDLLTERAVRAGLLRKTLMRKKLRKEVGDVEDRLDALYVLVCFLIIQVKANNTSTDILFEDLLLDVLSISDNEKLKRLVKTFVNKSQAFIGDL